MSDLKCWLAGSRYPIDHQFVDAVFAHTYKEARKIVWRDGLQINAECDGDFTDLFLKRFEQYDRLAIGDAAYAVRDDKTLHRLGWGEEGADMCDSCGLYQWEGIMTVCPECNQCNECGCCCDE